MNEHDYHSHVITVTQEENALIVALMQACRESLAETRDMFDNADVAKMSDRERELLHATMGQLRAMEEVLRVLMPLFQRAECKPEVIQ